MSGRVPGGCRGGVSAANRAAAAAELQKAKDLYSQQKYLDAYAETDKALLLDPSLVEAQSLRRVLQAKLEEGGDFSAAASANTGGGEKARVLNAQQISVIRLLETGANDNLIRGSVPRKVLEDFWENEIKKQSNANEVDLTQATHDRFISPNNFEGQARVIRDSGNLKYINQVTVTSDPAALVAFRNLVHPYVLQNCATADCHGGEKAGNFRIVVGGNNPPTVYTNFYIMSIYVAKNGGGKMIDRDHPEKSLFLQYSLPQAAAGYPHPGTVEVRKLGSVTDRRFQSMSAWVDSLGLIRPDYGIKFEVPKGTATRPASAQSE